MHRTSSASFGKCTPPPKITAVAVKEDGEAVPVSVGRIKAAMNSSIHVFGSDFHANDELRCSFLRERDTMRHTVQAAFKSESHVTCLVPRELEVSSEPHPLSSRRGPFFARHSSKCATEWRHCERRSVV